MPSYAAPVRARLVGPVDAAVPEGLTRVEQGLVLGVPQRLRLDAELELALIVPTGLAIEWRDGAPDASVSSSAPQRAPSDGDDPDAVGVLGAPPAQLVVLDRGQPVGVVPLVAGARRRIPAGGIDDRGVRVEIAVLDWDLRSGALRGPGDTLSRVVLAWRRLDRAADAFSVPPVPRKVKVRLAPAYVMESDLGLRRVALLSWSKAKMEVSR